jgi:hypothetical protein
VSELRRDERNLISSGLAYNAWHLLQHYRELTAGADPGETYESTLSICVLQTVLSNCHELFRNLRRKVPRMVQSVDSLAQSLLDDPEVKVESTFDETVTGRVLVEHIRNALSHPRMRNTEVASTGYVTVEDGSGLISRIELIDSPDINFSGHLTSKAQEKLGDDGSRARIFTIEMPVRHLTLLAEEIAFVLAQPVLGNWDGPKLLPMPD